MTSTDAQQLRERLRPYAERAAGFSGWVFDYSPKPLGDPAPWDYAFRARELLAGASSVLDLGTGGGERLAEILQGYRGRAAATEEWPVNAPIAAARLRPLGAVVLHCQSTILPFRHGAFDLVLDRHEILDPFETARVLAPGGAVLTQQVDSYAWDELRDYFPRMLFHGDHWAYYQAGFIAAGLAIASAQRHFSQAAYDLGELVYQLCVMPWCIPGFDPLGHDLDSLLALERDLDRGEGIELAEVRYLVEARKR